MTNTSTLLLSAEARKEMEGHISGPVPEFVETFFPSLKLANPEEAIPAPFPNDFVQWFTTFRAKPRDTTTSKWELKHFFCSEGEGVDISLVTSNGHVRVAGVRCTDDMTYADGLARLYAQARRIFQADSTRTLLHGFFIHGSILELWYFDRVGMFCSDAITGDDVRERFPALLSAYETLSDADAGVLGLIEHDDKGDFIRLDEPENKIYPESSAAESPVALFVDQTESKTAYKATGTGGGKYIISFTWEGEPKSIGVIRHMSMFVTKNVTTDNVVDILVKNMVTDTSKLRKGLVAGKGRALIIKEDPGQGKGLIGNSEVIEGAQGQEKRNLVCHVQEAI